MNEKAIGKVTATEKNPTTCTSVRFWVHRDVVIRPFDIVKIKHIAGRRDNEPSHTYAVVQDLHYITDSASHLANYVSSDFGDLAAEPQNERLGTTIAEAEVLYNDQEIEMPVHDGAVVEWADVEGIKDALGLRALQLPIPAGYISTSNGEEVPIEFEAAYLLGPEGAHLNIAGISGLATKTSYAMFLMNSIQQRMSNKVTMVIFNVKGSDLLAIDRPNPDLTDTQRGEWKKCGLEPTPFERVTYLYPFANRPDNGYTLSHIDLKILEDQIRKGQAFNYFYDIETGRRKLGLLFSDIDDPNSTMESIAHHLPEIDANSWEAFRRQIQPMVQKGSGKGGDIPLVSWRKFKRLLETRTDHDLFTERSLVKEKRHILIHEAIKRLKPGDVLVVDIEPLPDYLQCLVFGDVIQTIYAAKLGDEEDIEPNSLGTVVVFADELNKYAPKSSDSGRTLTRNLLEITERGRSLGMVLFGAEQFRSGVHDRVLGNCSTNIYGRTSPVEVAKCPDYKEFPQAYKSAITRLPKGNLLLQHAVFKTALLKVRFPFPCYYQPKVR
ncbi:MAG TPA: ATP-binding protein [Firmicutes bacterium]|nr:ATP-binding protein [Bacillota bacterium]